MKVISLNIGKKESVKWRGKMVETGIFKKPVSHPIFLGETDVKSDIVVDRRYHGGVDKACYLYSADHYAYWKEKFPNLDFQYGIFGENITVEGLNEEELQIGDIFSIGECRIQITQPRQPCFKLGIRFKSQTIVKQFINSPFPGVYVKIIEQGKVKIGDTLTLSERLHDSIGLLEVWDLLYAKDPNMDLMDFAINFHHLAEAAKVSLRKRLL